MAEFFKFLRSVFSESDGTGSWSRIASCVALIAVVGWVTYIIVSTKAIPSLDGPISFIAAPYAINLTHNGLTTIFSKQDNSGK